MSRGKGNTGSEPGARRRQRSRAQTTLDFAIGIGVFVIVVGFVFAFIPGMIQPFESAPQEQTAAANRIADTLTRGMLGKPGEPYELDRECTIVFFENESADGSDGDIGENTDGDDDVSDLYDSTVSTTLSGLGCNFEGVGLRNRVGLSGPGLSVRVRLVRDLADGGDSSIDPGTDDRSDVLCIDASTPSGYDQPPIFESGDAVDDGDGTDCDIDEDDDDVLLAIGPTPPETASSIVTARRVVSIESGLADGSTDAALIVEVWK